MNTNAHVTQYLPRRKIGLTFAVGLPVLLIALPLIGAEHGGAPRGGAARPAMSAPRPAIVDRSSHGSIRHVDAHVVERPVEVRREPEHPVEVHREGSARHEVFGHHDVDVDIHRRHFWSDFSFGRRFAVLPFGCLALQIGGVPYYYDDGIYYQPAEGGYQEFTLRGGEWAAIRKFIPPLARRFRNLPMAPSRSMPAARLIITPAARSMCSNPTVLMPSLPLPLASWSPNCPRVQSKFPLMEVSPTSSTASTTGPSL